VTVTRKLDEYGSCGPPSPLLPNWRLDSVTPAASVFKVAGVACAGEVAGEAGDSSRASIALLYVCSRGLKWLVKLEFRRRDCLDRFRSNDCVGLPVARRFLYDALRGPLFSWAALPLDVDPEGRRSTEACPKGQR
jgi:hypothetical protein